MVGMGNVALRCCQVCFEFKKGRQKGGMRLHEEYLAKEAAGAGFANGLSVGEGFE